MRTVDIFTDGACDPHGNRQGGWACILIYPSHKNIVAEKVLQGFEKDSTNNRMELTAVIEGLKALKEPCEVNIYSDSQYVCKAFNDNWISNWVLRNWAEVKNVDLWKTLLELTKKHAVKFTWVRGHSGNLWNERCDKLAVFESKREVK